MSAGRTDLEELGIRERWNSLNEYFVLIERRGIALNLATLAGHGNIRGSIVGYEDRRPTPDELSEMLHLLRQAIDDGAIGMSSGLIYPPGVYSDTEELVELAGILKQNGLIYTSHMRSEADGLVESVREIMRIGRESGARVHISHIKTAGERNWWKADEVIGLIEQARQTGVSLTCDRYPYTASSTDLDSLLPAWAYAGGNDEEMKRLMDPVDRERISKEIQAVAGKVTTGIR